MGFIYFISQNNKMCKIGFTNNIHHRLKELSTSSPFPLILLGYFEGSMKDEKMLHKKFAEFNIQREWYILNQEIIDYINKNTFTNTFCEFDGNVLRVYKTMKK